MTVMQNELNWLQKSMMDDLGWSSADVFRTKPPPPKPETGMESVAKAPGRFAEAAWKSGVMSVIANQAYVNERAANLAQQLGIGGTIERGLGMPDTGGWLISTASRLAANEFERREAISEEDRGTATFLGGIGGSIGQLFGSPQFVIQQAVVRGHRGTFRETGDDAAAFGSAVINGALAALGFKIGGAGNTVRQTVTRQTASGAVTTTEKIRQTAAQSIAEAMKRGGTSAAVKQAVKRTAIDTGAIGIATELGVIADEIQKGVWTDRTTDEVISQIKARTPEALSASLFQAIGVTGPMQAKGVFGAIRARKILLAAADLGRDGINPETGKPMDANEQAAWNTALRDYIDIAEQDRKSVV